MNGSFVHPVLEALRNDRADMGELDPYGLKIFLLDDLYPGNLSAAAFSLNFWHSEGNYPFGVAIFISNNFAGIGGYAFQQFTSTYDE